MEWIQLNIALSRQHGGALPAAKVLFVELLPLLKEWRQSGSLQYFFFMRKPPDLRLRFAFLQEAERAVQALFTMLVRLHNEGVVLHFFRSVYEPESALFGGIASMEHIHRYFDWDSQNWFELECVLVRDERKLQKVVIISSVLNDLYLKVLQEKTEVWDVWRRLTYLIQGDIKAAAPVPADIHTIPSLLNLMPNPAEVSVLERYENANQELAQGLLRVWSQGDLECGMRGLLAWISIFLFNRHGLGADRAAAIASTMTQLWDPREPIHQCS